MRTIGSDFLPVSQQTLNGLENYSGQDMFSEAALQQLLIAVLAPILQNLPIDSLYPPPGSTASGGGPVGASHPQGGGYGRPASSSSRSSDIRRTAGSNRSEVANAGNNSSAGNSSSAGNYGQKAKANAGNSSSYSKTDANPQKAGNGYGSTPQASTNTDGASNNAGTPDQSAGEYGNDGEVGNTVSAGNAPGEEINTNVDYRDMSKEERRASSGMSDRERDVLHLWGIQMTSEGSQDGGVLMNVLQNPEQFQDAEVELAKELQAQDQEQYGGITGKSLDNEFFQLYENMTGEDISERYGNGPIKFADGPVDMSARLSGDNGLNDFENQVLQLWGHSPLFNQGKIDGNIVDYALNSQNTLEANLNRSDLEALKEADLASDGVLNGDSLENAFLDTLDHLYLGGPSATTDKTMNDALQEAALRREGLLPPPEPGSGRAIEDVGAINPTQPGRDMSGGGCPFLAGA